MAPALHCRVTKKQTDFQPSSEECGNPGFKAETPMRRTPGDKAKVTPSLEPGGPKQEHMQNPTKNSAEPPTLVPHHQNLRATDLETLTPSNNLIKKTKQSPLEGMNTLLQHTVSHTGCHTPRWTRQKQCRTLTFTPPHTHLNGTLPAGFRLWSEPAWSWELSSALLGTLALSSAMSTGPGWKLLSELALAPTWEPAGTLAPSSESVPLLPRHCTPKTQEVGRQDSVVLSFRSVHEGELQPGSSERAQSESHRPGSVPGRAIMVGIFC